MADRVRAAAVTGAFSFTGRAIAEALLARDQAVLTLTNHPRPADPLAERVAIAPLDFDRPDRLARSLKGIDTLYDTFWIRFPRGTLTFEWAEERSAALLDAARRAGVRRVVHLSVVGADPDGPTPYVRAKGRVEGAVRAAGFEWAIVRPTLTYGPNDILINNLAWALRRLPVYGIPGDGRYRIQPVHVDDVARICVEAAEAETGTLVDAAGPEALEYRDLVALVRRAVGSRSVVVSMPAWAVLAAARGLGLVVRDVVLTRHEIEELSTGYLTSDEPPRGRIRIADWLLAHAGALGRRWASELARHYDR